MSGARSINSGIAAFSLRLRAHRPPSNFVGFIVGRLYGRLPVEQALFVRDVPGERSASRNLRAKFNDAFCRFPMARRFVTACLDYDYGIEVVQPRVPKKGYIFASFVLSSILLPGKLLETSKLRFITFSRKLDFHLIPRYIL